MDRHMHEMAMADESDVIRDCLSDLLWAPDTDGHARAIGLPSGQKLRSVVVIEDRGAAARLVFCQFGAGGPRRILQAGAVSTLILSGLAVRIRALQFVLPALSGRLGYRDWLKGRLSAEARVGAILMGPPRANRKPVVLLSGVSGNLVAVAKFGLTDVTGPLVRHEAVALRRVREALGETLHVPEFLDSGLVGKGEVLLMAPLPAPAPGRRPTRTALIEVVRKISHIDRRPGADLRNIASHPRLTPLRPRIDEVMRCCSEVEVGSFHGDLHPGNLAMARDGRVMLWDWERWGYGAPVGFDLLHHDLHSWISRDGMAPREAAKALIVQAPSILAPLGVARSAAPAVGRDYLIRLGARYVADQQDRAGSELGAVEQWLFPAVLK